MRKRAVAIAVLGVVAAGCGSESPPAKEAPPLVWTAMTLEYSGVMTEDCMKHPTYKLQATCQTMLKPSIQSMGRYAQESLPVSKERADLGVALDGWLTALDEFDDKMCYGREKAIDCITGPTLLNLKLTTIQGRINQGVKAEQTKANQTG